MSKLNDVLIGKRIRQWRKKRGYSQMQFAEVVDLSTNYLSGIECGKKHPTLYTFIRIVNALDCTADDLLTDLIPAARASGAAQLLEELASLPQEQYLVALTTMDAMVSAFKNSKTFED